MKIQETVFGTSLYGRPRPRKVIAPSIGVVLLMVVLVGVARASGSGWVQFIGALISAGIVAGAVSPFFALRKTRITIHNVGFEGIRLDTSYIELESNGFVMAGAFGKHPMPLKARCVEHLPFTPAHVGRIDEIKIELSSAAPFGILWWHRKVTLKLKIPFFVLPRPLSPMSEVIPTKSKTGNLLISSTRGSIKGTVEFSSYHTFRDVHWPVTAHAGKLMAKEYEIEKSTSYEVVANFQNIDPALIDNISESATGTVQQLLNRGHDVMLAAKTPNGYFYQECASLKDTQRFLARVVS